MSSGKILLSYRFRLPGYQQGMRTQDGTHEVVRVVRRMRKLSVFWNFVKPRKVYQKSVIPGGEYTSTYNKIREIRWIPVSEGYPDNSRMVLITLQYENGDYEIDIAEKGSKVDFSRCPQYRTGIIKIDVNIYDG